MSVVNSCVALASCLRLGLSVVRPGVVNMARPKTNRIVYAAICAVRHQQAHVNTTCYHSGSAGTTRTRWNDSINDGVNVSPAAFHRHNPCVNQQLMVRHLTLPSSRSSAASQDKPNTMSSKDQEAAAPAGSKPEVVQKSDDDQTKKLSIVQRLKKMFKEYWYVLLPVHIGTSAIFLGTFYYLAKCGMDIVPLLEYLGAGEMILKPLRNTGVGYWAVTYALYKLATPIRYAITLGGTTFSIKYLHRWGLIRPMPSSDQMKAMFDEKRRQLKSKRAQSLAKINAKRKSNGTNANEKSSPKSDS